MIGMKRLAIVGIAPLVLAAGLPATAHADSDPVNVPVSESIRAELVQAGAILTGRPASEFGGLREGGTYVAQDPSNGAEWAAAALYANPGEYWAGVQLQDQNSYMAFSKMGIPGSTWVPIAIGYGPIAAGEEPCPLPENVRALWGWPDGKCYPQHIR